MEEPNMKDTQFRWGKKRGVGGAKRDVQFYESCTFGDVTYELYDCVYLFKKGESEPFIGKIVKLWEQADGKKKAKILWFFLPCEILNYLDEHNVLENEIFLASGDGVGLTNINPLEAIAAKCSVICISKDVRNPPASSDALEKANFTFYRIFDVGSLTISDNFPEKIAGIEVESLLNREEDQVTKSFTKDGNNGLETNGKADAGLASSSIPNQTKNKAETDLSQCKPSKKLKLSDSSVKSSSDGLEKTETVTGAEKDNHDEISTPLNRESFEKAKLSEKEVQPVPEFEKSSDGFQKNKILTGAKKDDSDESSFPLKNENSGRAKLSENKANSTHESLQKLPSKKIKLSDNSEKSSDGLQRTMTVSSAKKDCPDESSIPLNEENYEKAKLIEQKVKASHEFVKSSDGLQKTKIVTGAKKDDSDKSSIPLNKENSEKAKLSDKKLKPSHESLQKLSSEKIKLSDNSKSSDGLQRAQAIASVKKDNSDDSSIPLKKENSEKAKLNEQKVKPSDESLQKLPPVSSKKNADDVSLQKMHRSFVKKNTEASQQVVEVSRRPDADRSKWFKQFPWEGRLKKAHEQGTLVFLENFDRSFTSRDIEDIMHHTFNQSCTAKVIPCLPPYNNPHHGQAYAIFKSAGAADEVVRRINTGCLMLPDGSAFIAGKGMLPEPPKANKFPGHLIIRTKRLQQEEWRKAVYTSHCSQPNTVEYEMSMDWILMQEKAVNSFGRLYKGHGDEIKHFRKHLKIDK